MPVKITVNENISLNTLREARELGYQVEETPHVGNLSISTLGLISLGFTPKLVDANIGEKDNLFYPHLKIKDGAADVIARGDVMSTHNITICGMPVSDYHTQPLEQMGLPAFTHSSWITQRAADIAAVLEVINQDKVRMMWRRYVNADGVTELREPGTKILDNVHKVTASAQGEGWVIPNPINILLDLVFASIETDKDKVYMLSGQSMYRYIGKNYDRFGPMNLLISDLYDRVAASRGGLPKELNVEMVPIPALRHFVVPDSRKELLDAKLKYLDKLRAGNSRVGQKFAAGIISKEAKQRLQQKRQQHFRNITDWISNFSADSETGIFYTQHDLVNYGESLYIPPSVLDSPISQLIKTAEAMKKFSRNGGVVKNASPSINYFCYNKIN